ncbi:MAG: DUF488 domain-containing protein [Mycobacteriales bacterium]
MINLHRVYDPEPPPEGCAYLVERLWPRGVRRDALRLDGWAQEAAPSTELRRWFGHDPAKWAEFRHRYTRELDANPQAWAPLAAAARRGNLVLLYSSRDTEHNNAVVLRDYLTGRTAAGQRG